MNVEKDIIRNTKPEIQAYATYAAMKRLGIDPKQYAGDGMHLQCKHCGSYYNYPIYWMNNHPNEVAREILEYKRNQAIIREMI